MTNLFIIALPVVITINLLLGMTVLFTNSRRLANRVFAILSLIFALWLFCQYLGSIATSEVWLEFWIRQACATSVFIPLLFHLLRSAAVRPAATLFDLLRRSRAWLLSVVAAAVLSQTRFFLVGARLSVGGNAIAEPLYGPGLYLFTGFWVVAVVCLVWSFFRSLQRSEGVYRMELQIMAYGSLFALVPGVLLVLVIPLLTGSSQSARFTPIAVVTWHSVIAYGIATRHIMGVGEFFRRTLVWVLVGCALVLLYLVVFRLILALPFDGTDAVLRTAAHGVAAFVVAISLSPAKGFLGSHAERLFEREQYDLSQLVHEGGDLARSIATLDVLFADFFRLLQATLGVSQMRVYLRSGARFVPHRDRSQDREPSGSEAIAESNPLVLALQRVRHPLLRDVLRRANGTPLELEAECMLAQLHAEAAVALRSKNGIAGFLLLGRRRKGKVYGKREENALMFLGQEMGFAIENAALYTHLRDARAYNEILLDHLVTGVVAMDRDERVTVCNREAQHILEIAEPERVVGHPASGILPAPIMEELRASFVSARGIRDRDLVLESQSPDERSVRFSTAVLGDEEGGVSGVLLVLQDTSTIRKLEEQVRRNDRLASLGTLAAGMAHEIKNPLVCLKTFVQLLPSQYDNPEFRESFIPLLGKEVERINTIVSQLLNFSRPVKPELLPISMHAALDAAGQLAVQPIKTKGLVLQRRYEAERDALLGDSRLLGQVFLNLLLNGIDAMEEGGTLTVSTRLLHAPEQPWRYETPSPEAWIEVRVSDTGCGIPSEEIRRVFDPFFTTKANGTGLGLAVALGIIQEHFGSIDVTSTPGNGSCFRVLLPLLPGSDAKRIERTKGSI